MLIKPILPKSKTVKTTVAGSEEAGLGWAAQQAMKVWWYRVIDRLIGEQSGAWI
jgi:hypothetical protein